MTFCQQGILILVLHANVCRLYQQIFHLLCREFGSPWITTLSRCLTQQDLSCLHDFAFAIFAFPPSHIISEATTGYLHKIKRSWPFRRQPSSTTTLEMPSVTAIAFTDNSFIPHQSHRSQR